MYFYIVLALSTWIIWRVVRAFFSRSPLEKISGPPSASYLTGNVPQLLSTQSWDFHHEISERFGSVVKINGLFNKPWLYIHDPLALEHILKHTEVYDELPWYLQSNAMMLGPGLLSVTGDVHRKQRKMLAPVFSASHLRELVPVFYQVTHRLVAAISAHIEDGREDVDVFRWMSRVALELAGQTAMGHSFDPLTEEVSDPYADAVKRFAPEATSPEMILLRQATPFVKSLGPAWFRRWIVERLPSKTLQKIIQISDTLQCRASDILQTKKGAMEADGVNTKEIISMLLKANMETLQEDRLPDEQLLGQITSILFASVDTTANAISRMLHLLAQHKELQDKLRREIMAARTHGNVDYDALNALPYLDAVCRETLRVYPPAPQTWRGTMKDAILPLSSPLRGKDGSVINDIVIPEGTNIIIGIMAYNRDKKLWGDDACEWIPERWLKRSSEAVETATAAPSVYSHMMTFLGGPRSCIGFTYAQLEMKAVLCELLANFTFDPSHTPAFWNFAGITYPCSDPDGTAAQAQLRMKVRRLQD